MIDRRCVPVQEESYPHRIEACDRMLHENVDSVIGCLEQQHN